MSAVTVATEPVPAQALEMALRQAITALDGEPGGAEHRRVLERTYLHGSPSQEAAAEVLGLSFSTYRRHLARAQERLVEVLWAVEVGQAVPAPVGGSEHRVTW
jgi:DNA-directed RNA polymerase specialized sigma24 family protein